MTDKESPKVEEAQTEEFDAAKDLASKLQWMDKVLGEVKDHLALFIRHPFFQGEDIKLPLAFVPGTVHTNMRSNLGLVYRRLEDARMRTALALVAMGDVGRGVLNQGWPCGIHVSDCFKAPAGDVANDATDDVAEHAATDNE
jgi:hypothetical protein